MKTAFIVNPISGKKGKGSARLEKVDAFHKARPWPSVAWQTEYAGHATELAQRAVEEGYERVACVGGDGTINEVGKALVGTGCVFALVPMGSGNGLARHLGMPLAFDDALQNIEHGHIHEIDTGEANGHSFFNVMGVGLDAQIGKSFNETKGRGFANYLKEGFKVFASYEPIDCSVEADGQAYPLDASYIVAIANSAQYGNNAYIAPDASVKDGKLNLVAIAKPNIFRAIALVYRLFAKKVYGSPCVKAIVSDRFKLRLPSSGFFHADGEIFEYGEEIEVLAKASSLKILAPKGVEA